MADGVFNIAKGRGVEFYNRVKNNDPANSAFFIVLAFGAATDATIRDYDDLAALLGDAGITEATFTSYVRKTLTDTDLAVLPAPDDTNDRYEVDLPDQTWSPAGGATNNTLTRLFVCYDADDTVGTDANIIPVTFHDFVVTTDGSDLTAQFDALGFLRAA